MDGRRAQAQAGTLGEAWRFVLRLYLVTLPILLAFIVGELVLWRLADGVYPARAAQAQHDDPTLAWIGPFRLNVAMKVARARLERPDIVVIGASRAGEFRSAMFKPYGFYNMSMAARSIRRLREVLDVISTDHPPKAVIINLDFFIFAKGFETWANVVNAEQATPLAYSNLRANFDGLNALSQIMAQGRWGELANELTQPRGGRLGEFRTFGLTLLPGSGAGFLRDGSMLYFPEYVQGAKRLVNVLGQVAPGAGGGMDEGQLDQLRGLARLAKSRGVTLVGVQLPYLREAVTALDAGKDYAEDGKIFRGADMRIWREFESGETRALFESMGILFVDFARLPGSEDPRAFIDSMHPGEALVLASVIAALHDPRVRQLLPAIDIDALERTRQEADAAGNFLNVFGSRF